MEAQLEVNLSSKLPFPQKDENALTILLHSVDVIFRSFLVRTLTPLLKLASEAAERIRMELSSKVWVWRGKSPFKKQISVLLN